MARNAGRTRLLVVTFAYGALGTGVFAGCGEPGMQSQDSPARPNGTQISDANPVMPPSAPTGLRHSTSDELALSQPARSSKPAAITKGKDSVAPCNETEYATDDMEQSSPLRREGGDTSAPCHSP